MNKKTTLLLLLVLFSFYSCKNLIEKSDKEQKSERIVETGELQAVETYSFILKRVGRYWYESKVVGLVKHGTLIEKGDSVIQFDVSEIQKMIVDSEDRLKNSLAQLEKLKINQKTELFNLENQLKSETSNFELKKLDLESSRFEAEKIKKIKALEFEQAKIRFEQVKHSVKLKKTVMRTDMQLQQETVQRLKQEIAETRTYLSKMTIRTPIAGIFQVGEKWDGKAIKIGDVLYSGMVIGSVPNIEWMKVETQISELDFLKIKKGQKVTVRLDAMPEYEFKGVVSFISKFCYKKDEKSQQKVFNVEVKLLQSDSRLKPGMTVSCEFHK